MDKSIKISVRLSWVSFVNFITSGYYSLELSLLRLFKTQAVDNLFLA